MKLLRQLGIILLIFSAGQIINEYAGIPIPGSVIGMLILFILLSAGIIKLEMIEEVSKFLLDHLAFFFLPAGVGLIACYSLLKGSLAAVLLITVFTTVLVMLVSGYTVQWIKGSGKK